MGKKKNKGCHTCRVCKKMYDGRLIEIHDLPKLAKKKKKKIAGYWTEVVVPYKNGRVCPECVKRIRGKQ